MRYLHNTYVIRLMAALLVMCGVQAFAAALAPGVRWQDPSSMDLSVDFPGQGYHADWHLFRCSCGDLLVRAELVAPGEVTHADILLVAKRAVLMRGYDAEAAEQVSIDAPALMMQLAMRLLERGEPAGPSAITDRRQVEVEDKINYINLDSGVAAGQFPPPWRVTAATISFMRLYASHSLKTAFRAIKLPA